MTLSVEELELLINNPAADQNKVHKALEDYRAYHRAEYYKVCELMHHHLASTKRVPSGHKR